MTHFVQLKVGVKKQSGYLRQKQGPVIHAFNVLWKGPIPPRNLMSLVGHATFLQVSKRFQKGLFQKITGFAPTSFKLIQFTLQVKLTAQKLETGNGCLSRLTNCLQKCLKFGHSKQLQKALGCILPHNMSLVGGTKWTIWMNRRQNMSRERHS